MCHVGLIMALLPVFAPVTAPVAELESEIARNSVPRASDYWLLQHTPCSL